jgi:hypothetical protein
VSAKKFRRAVPFHGFADVHSTAKKSPFRSRARPTPKAPLQLCVHTHTGRIVL